jgi:cell division protein FtsI (penicillin-binding protein 3)
MELNGHGDFVNVQNLKPELVTDLPQAENVQLTIDARVQYAAESALAKGLESAKAERGAVIILNPRNGEVLAFAVAPDFNPESYYKAKPEALKNWAITDVYPPGSTFKILTIASGLEAGVINKNSTLHDTGLVRMNGFTIKNYDYASHGAPGNIDLVYLFQHSSNIGSMLVSLMIDPAEHHRLLHNFGMGEKTHIDIPGESAGILHPPEKWDQLTHATIGFGYGLAATPIQMASAVAAIANDGVWITPHFIKNETNVAKHRVISENTAHTVTELLAESIETAKTSTVRLDGFRLAGKTGTSRKPNDKGKGYTSQVFTSFVGYFPAEDPQVLVMVVVDSPGIGNAWGSTVAGPIFKEIATQTSGYLGIKPNLMATQSPNPKPL